VVYGGKLVFRKLSIVFVIAPIAFTAACSSWSRSSALAGLHSAATKGKAGFTDNTSISVG
jgi:hypothetical protein